MIWFDYARRTQLDLVIFTVPIAAEGRILQMLLQALGPADRHPARGPCQQNYACDPGPIPISATFRFSMSSTVLSRIGISF